MRGDAIAGLLIVFVNIVGGIVIGVAQKGMSFGAASSTYMLLTVGDGLVSQIPALVVSTAAGMLVSKAGITGSADKALFGQLGGYPRALALCGVLMVALSLLPGIPMVPFLSLAAFTGGSAWFLGQRKSDAAARDLATAAVPAATEPQVAGSPPVDEVRIELGYGLLPLVNGQGGSLLTEQVKGLRRQLASELGFVLPAVRIQDNLQLGANAYAIRIKEIVAGRGELRHNMVLVMDPRGEPINLPGEKTTEPTFGLPAMWVPDTSREDAQFRGYTVVDPATVITTHLTEIIKDNMDELLSYAETKKLLDELDKDRQKLVADMIPSQISVGGIQRVLKALLKERVSIRDLPTILEGISEACSFTQSTTAIIEHVRARLARQISHAATTDAGFVPLVTLSPEWEQTFAEALKGERDERQLALAPSKLQEFIAKVRTVFDRHALMGETPALLTSPLLRPYVRSIIERIRPATMVLSQNEIHPKVKIKTLDQV